MPELVERCFLGTLTENSEHKHTQSTSTLWKGARGLYKGEVWTGAGEAGQRGSWEHVQSLQASSSSAPSTEGVIFIPSRRSHPRTMPEGTSSENQNPASTSAGGSENGATASNSGSGPKTLLSRLIEKLEQTYGLMGVSVSRFSASDGSSLGAMFETGDDLSSMELGQALGFQGDTNNR